MVMHKKLSSGVSQSIQNTMECHKNQVALVEQMKPQEFFIKIANTLEERRSVFQLGYDVYLQKGFIKKNANEWLIRNYDFQGDTVILMVQDRNKNIAGSATLVFDGNLQLPAEKNYKKELMNMRQLGFRTTEFSRLVINPDFRNSKEILVMLFNYAAIYIHQVKRYNGLAIQVNPRHKNFYKALLEFQEIGGEQSCPQVQNAPSVLLYLTEEKYREACNKREAQGASDRRSLYSYFLDSDKESLVAHYLAKQAKPMSEEEKMYFKCSDSGVFEAVCV